MKKQVKNRKLGAIVVNSPKELAENSELVIITVVKDADAVKQISFEKDGIVEGKHKKLIVADMSTVIDPSESIKICKRISRTQH